MKARKYFFWLLLFALSIPFAFFGRSGVGSRVEPIKESPAGETRVAARIDEAARIANEPRPPTAPTVAPAALPKPVGSDSKRQKLEKLMDGVAERERPYARDFAWLVLTANGETSGDRSSPEYEARMKEFMSDSDAAAAMIARFLSGAADDAGLAKERRIAIALSTNLPRDDRPELRELVVSEFKKNAEGRRPSKLELIQAAEAYRAATNFPTSVAASNFERAIGFKTDSQIIRGIMSRPDEPRL